MRGKRGRERKKKRGSYGIILGIDLLQVGRCHKRMGRNVTREIFFHGLRFSSSLSLSLSLFLTPLIMSERRQRKGKQKMKMEQMENGLEGN